MSEDLPRQRHAASVPWMFFMIGTAVLLVAQGILYEHKNKIVDSLSVSTITSKATADSTNEKKDPFFRSIIKEASELYDVEPELIQAIIMAESSYNPKAVSIKGARGLMQLMPSTARALGVEDIFNPKHNIHGGVRYFKQLLDRFDGDTEMALAAYNAGSRKVLEYNGIPPFRATQQYIKKVFTYYRSYKDDMA